jgi:hypothetical protein
MVISIVRTPFFGIANFAEWISLIGLERGNWEWIMPQVRESVRGKQMVADPASPVNRNTGARREVSSQTLEGKRGDAIDGHTGRRGSEPEP